ncbi:MAG: hypothetical protein ACJATS_000669 [Psychroserpens sp.]|jgi:hypothetical protein
MGFYNVRVLAGKRSFPSPKTERGYSEMVKGLGKTLKGLRNDVLGCPKMVLEIGKRAKGPRKTLVIIPSKQN